MEKGQEDEERLSSEVQVQRVIENLNSKQKHQGKPFITLPAREM